VLTASTQNRTREGWGLKWSGSWVILHDSLVCPSCPSPPPQPPADMDMNLELQQLREERNRLDAELQLSAHLIQQEVGRAREQGMPAWMGKWMDAWMGQRGGGKTWGLGHVLQENLGSRA
jgi:hypothetical protein